MAASSAFEARISKTLIAIELARENDVHLKCLALAGIVERVYIVMHSSIKMSNSHATEMPLYRGSVT